MSTICDDLRAAILQAAMQGKILNGDFRFKNIEINDNVYEFPDHWTIDALGDLKIIPANVDVYEGKKRYYSTGSITDSGATPEGEYTYKNKPSRAGRTAILNSVIEAKMQSTVKATIIEKELEGSLLSTGFFQIGESEAYTQQYIQYYLRSPIFINQKTSLCTGTTQKAINDKNLKTIKIPILPIKEQECIVKKVDELMARVADLEQSADALASLKKAFPDDIKASLLQAAMQGKLTKQLPEDGSAEDLLEEIKAEKEKLITEGKIKKQKPLAPITDDEISFSIPENWKWVRLNDIVVKEIRRGKPPVYDKNGSSFAFAQKCNTKYTGIDLSLAKAISNNSLKKYSEDDAIATSDIIVNSTGTGTLGRVGFIDPKIPMNTNYYPDSHVTIVRVPKFISNYVYAILKNSEKYFEEKGEGSTNQKELKPLTIQNLIIPLPPIAEQKRIVERLNSILQNVNAVGDLIASE